MGRALHEESASLDPHIGSDSRWGHKDVHAENLSASQERQEAPRRSREPNGSLDGLIIAGLSRGTLERRFWSKVDRRGPSECWNWTGCREASGYGSIAVTRNRPAKAHRVSLFVAGRPPTADEVTRHLCHNKHCVNPGHLTPGSQAENIADSKRDGRLPAGATHSRAILTEDQAWEILTSHESDNDIRLRLGVKYNVVRDVRLGRTWSSYRPDLPRTKRTRKWVRMVATPAPAVSR